MPLPSTCGGDAANLLIVVGVSDRILGLVLAHPISIPPDTPSIRASQLREKAASVEAVPRHNPPSPAVPER